MRIVHISDIHLSSKNFSEFEDNYVDALLETLEKEHKDNNIDIIVITGDLLDQGGHSLLQITRFNHYLNPYKIFEDEFITPIKKRLSFDNSRFLFIAGNHDIDENEILWIDEKKMKKDIDKDSVNKFLEKNKEEITSNNLRIKKFKNFEEEFHKDSANYIFSNNESTYIYETDENIKIGFALINDCWRCSTCKLHDDGDNLLYFGSKQLQNSLKIFKIENTTMNVVLTHHPLKMYAEQEEVKRIILNKDYHLHLYGDQHYHEYQNYISANGSCLGIMARASFNNPNEPASKWQPGFQIIDIEFSKAIVEKITYYLYVFDNTSFGYDSMIATPDGIDRTQRPLFFDKVLPKINAQDLDRDKFNQL